MRDILPALILTFFFILNLNAQDDKNQFHFGEFNEVRAYRINWDNEITYEGIIDESGSLNKTRLPIEGVKLNQAQVARLEKTVMLPHDFHESSECFFPHHAFIFTNSEDEIVASINICLLCEEYSGYPEGFSLTWNLESIKTLMKELNIPLENKEWPSSKGLSPFETKDIKSHRKTNFPGDDEDSPFAVDKDK